MGDFCPDENDSTTAKRRHCVYILYFSYINFRTSLQGASLSARQLMYENYEGSFVNLLRWHYLTTPQLL